MKHVKHDERIKHSSFRQLAIGAWGSPTDPKVYTKIKCDITNLQTLLKHKSEKAPISLLHFFTYVMGQVFYKYPELNRVLLRGKLYQRASVDAFIHTHIREKKQHDLSGITLTNIHEQSLEEVRDLIKKKTRDIRQKKKQVDTTYTENCISCSSTHSSFGY
ncbi:2-oxo acid dehydrogenase subunit E2 [bacterium]|nr:2-oxo acid dehydrogenase subunit E2 [bacterium]